MKNLSWGTVKEQYSKYEPVINKTIMLTQEDIKRYPKMNDNGEHLSQLLANLNYYVGKLGELHATTEQWKMWTEKRYEIEKGLELDRLIRVDKVGVTQAGGAKYKKVQEFLDIMVECARIDKRVQNCRSSARDTTEAIRSRIGQLRGQQRS